MEYEIHDFRQDFEDIPHENAIFLKILKNLRESDFHFPHRNLRSIAREDDFSQNKTILDKPISYKIGIGSISQMIKL